MGFLDPCLYHLGRINFHLGWKLRAYSRADLPPTGVWLIPIAIFHNCHRTIHTNNGRHLSITNLLYISLLFLCRPEEYCRVRADTCLSPFRIFDLLFSVGLQTLRASDANSATSGAPIFPRSPTTTGKTPSVGIPLGTNNLSTPTPAPYSASTPANSASEPVAPQPPHPYA